MITLKPVTPVNLHRDFDDSDDPDIVFLDPELGDPEFLVPVQPIRHQLFEKLVAVEFYEGIKYNVGFFGVDGLRLNDAETGFQFSVNINQREPARPDYAKIFHTGSHLLTFKLTMLEFGRGKLPPEEKSNFLGLYLTSRRAVRSE
jgi:hypothetical protein